MDFMRPGPMIKPMTLGLNSCQGRVRDSFSIYNILKDERKLVCNSGGRNQTKLHELVSQKM